MGSEDISTNQKIKGTRREQDKLLFSTSTLYIGNLSFYTTEEQITELFAKCGDIKRVVMGLDKVKRVSQVFFNDFPDFSTDKILFSQFFFLENLFFLIFERFWILRFS